MLPDKVEAEIIEVQESNSSVDWTRVIIAFFTWVLLPLILIWGVLELQRQKHSHEKQLAGISAEVTKQGNKWEFIRKSSQFVVEITQKVLTAVTI